MYEHTRYSYGNDPSQFAELYLSSAPKSRGVAVVIHGGYWKSEYGADLGAPLASDLASRGFHAWNLETAVAGPRRLMTWLQVSTYSERRQSRMIWTSPRSLRWGTLPEVI
jgi:hypothetical protein